MFVYQGVLALHIIAIICWMAGVLYLFRLFVYHAEEKEAVVKERFSLMEQRLYTIIVVPASTLAVILGITLLYLQPAHLSHGWMHTKLLLVFILLGLSHGAKSFHRKLSQGKDTHSGKFYRILNEVPTLLMVLIVFLVVMRPF